jgi:hypothetical protein
VDQYIDKSRKIISAEKLQGIEKVVPVAAHPNLRAGSAAVSRNLQYYSELQLRVVSYSSTSTVYFDDSYSSIPATPSDLLPSLTHSVGITRLMRAISNQQFLSYKKTYTLLNIQLDYTDFNAYYDGSKIVIGFGLAVADVMAHEWAHGYTDYTSNLIYSYQSGAINEAMSDVFGESYDILQKGAAVRSSAQTCTSYNWAYRSLPTGSDSTIRWIMGDEIANNPYSSCGSLCAIRDM